MADEHGHRDGEPVDRPGPTTPARRSSQAVEGGDTKDAPAPQASADPVPDDGGRVDSDDGTGPGTFQSLTLEARWAGILPPPNVLKAYPENVQEKILAWQEDQVLGEAKREHELWQAESKRQDKLVDSATKLAELGQKIAAGLFIASIVAAFALAWRGNNVGAGIALAPAVLGFLGKYLEPWLERDAERKQPPLDPDADH